MSEMTEEVITAGASWPEHYTYSPALRVGNTVYNSGTTGTDDEGKITAPGDIVEQTRQIYRKFERLLNAAGGIVCRHRANDGLSYHGRELQRYCQGPARIF
jgi:enamine deaminase RidA (YjgF/YER057c/UK114 family)